MQVKFKLILERCIYHDQNHQPDLTLSNVAAHRIPHQIFSLVAPKHRGSGDLTGSVQDVHTQANTLHSVADSFSSTSSYKACQFLLNQGKEAVYGDRQVVAVQGFQQLQLPHPFFFDVCIIVINNYKIKNQLR